MARNKSKHTGKTKAERDFYNRLIKNLDFEPTQSESINFNESNEKDEDYSVQTSNNPRRRPLTHSIGDHFRENVAAYIMSVLGIFLLYFMVDSKVDIATIKEKVLGIDEKANRIETELENVENKIEKNTEKLHEQEIKLIQNTVDKEKNEK